MTDLTEQEVCIGSLGQQKVYLHWPDVKDICTYAVSAAYEQTKRENAQLKELLKECQGSIATLLAKMITEVNGTKQKELLTKIDEVLGEKK